MKEKLIFELNSVYRDNMRIKGYSFGEGEESACIVGATRGNEVQQLYICSRLINIFKQLEHQGKIKYGKSVMVIPTVNSHSMNIGKRFWSTDNTDINRMFPGYNLGETTQRIAAGVFENISSYKFGIQFTSFYMQGDYIPHVRVMQTGFEDIELAKDFGLPYVYRRNARPYDTTTLNYNWQLWETKAFSVYTSATVFGLHKRDRQNRRCQREGSYQRGAQFSEQAGYYSVQVPRGFYFAVYRRSFADERKIRDGRNIYPPRRRRFKGKKRRRDSGDNGSVHGRDRRQGDCSAERNRVLPREPTADLLPDSAVPHYPDGRSGIEKTGKIILFRRYFYGGV